MLIGKDYGKTGAGQTQFFGQDFWPGYTSHL